MRTTTTTDLAEHVIATLRAHEAELRRAGIRHLSLFGSVARGDAGASSDVDLAAGIIAARTDPSRAVDVRRLRERLCLTRARFAASCGIEVETLRDRQTGNHVANPNGGNSAPLKPLVHWPIIIRCGQPPTSRSRSSTTCRTTPS